MSTSSRFHSLTVLADKLFTPAAQVLSRLVFGQAFALTGWGKLNNLEKTTQFFESLGIPMASVQAPFIGTVEFVGGILLVLGLGTRFAALLLTCTMVVAVLTAHLGQFSQAFAFEIGFDDIAPLPYLVALLWLLAKGAGALSLDHVIAKKKARG